MKKQKSQHWLVSGLVFFCVLVFSSTSFAETDVTAMVRLNKSLLMYDRLTKQSYLDVSLTNVSPEVLLTPIKVVIDSISTTAVTVANADGVTADGKPYFDYAMDSGQLLAGVTTAVKRWKFANPAAVRFSYSVLVKGNLPEAVQVIDIGGGSIETLSGVRLDVPAGSLSAPQTITAAAAPDEILDAPVADNNKLLTAVFFGPSGLVFDNPARITFPLPVFFTPGSILPIFIYNEPVNMFVDSGFTCEVGADGYSCTGEVKHFTIFAIILPMAAPAIDRDSDGYQGPIGDNTDCNDFDMSVHPEAPEICGDGIDQDCDGGDLVCATDLDLCGLPSGSLFINDMFAPTAALDCGQKLKLLLFVKNFYQQFFQHINLKYKAVEEILTANDVLQLTRSTAASTLSIAGVLGNPSSAELISSATGAVGDYGIIMSSFLERDDLGPVEEAVVDGFLQTSSCVMQAVIDQASGEICTANLATQGLIDAISASAVYSLNKDMTELLLAQDFLLEYFRSGEQLDINKIDEFAQEKGWCNGWFCFNDYDLDDVRSYVATIINNVESWSERIDPEGDGLPEAIDNDDDGFSETQGDCNDSDAQLHPDTVWYRDADGDGYYDGTTITQCQRGFYYYLPSELSSMEIDCDDSNSSINPGALENCSDSIDNNCNGAINENCVVDSDNDGIPDDVDLCAGTLGTEIADATGCAPSQLDPGIDLNAGLVAYYPFNGNAHDESGNGNDGTEVGGVTLTEDRFGNVNSAYDFNGINAAIIVTDHFDYGNQLTITAWIRPDVVNSAQRMIWDDYGNPGVILGVTGEKVQFSLSTEADPGLGVSVYDGAVEEQKWQHLVGTYNGNEMRVYLNGVHTGQVQTTNGAIIDNGTNPASIGADSWYTNMLNFDGQIDDIRIYNRALSEAEIQELFNQVNPQTDSDNDGIPDDVDLCAGTPAGEPVDAIGCPAVGVHAPEITFAEYDDSRCWNYITWTDEGAAEYRVYWGTESGVTTGSELLTSTATLAYGHSGVLPGSTYYYRVQAVFDDGTLSDLSPEVSVMVPADTGQNSICIISPANGFIWYDGTPQSIMIDFIGDVQLIASQGISFAFSTDNGNNWLALPVTESDGNYYTVSFPLLLSDSSVLVRAVSISDPSVVSAIVQGDILANHPCSDKDGDSFPGEEWCVVHGLLIDCDDNNPAIHPGAAEVCGDGIDQNCDSVVDAPDCPVVEGPTPEITFAEYDDSRCWNYITWTDEGAAEYRVYWGTESGVTTGSELLSPTTTLAYGHTGVLPGWTYYYRVQAVLADGTLSELSAEVSVMVPIDTVQNCYHLPDTGLTKCYNNIAEIHCPQPGEPFYGQDANYTINPPSYMINGDGTVTDNNTGLMWQREDDNLGRYWDAAVNYCENLDLAGYEDWRLPSQKELVGIVDYDLFNPAIDMVAFPGTNPYGYWSSSSGVNFYNGVCDFFNIVYVRCVRGEQRVGH